MKMTSKEFVQFVLLHVSDNFVYEVQDPKGDFTLYFMDPRDKSLVVSGGGWIEFDELLTGEEIAPGFSECEIGISTRYAVEITRHSAEIVDLSKRLNDIRQHLDRVSEVSRG